MNQSCSLNERSEQILTELGAVSHKHSEELAKYYLLLLSEKNSVSTIKKELRKRTIPANGTLLGKASKLYNAKQSQVELAVKEYWETENHESSQLTTLAKEVKDDYHNYLTEQYQKATAKKTDQQKADNAEEERIPPERMRREVDSYGIVDLENFINYCQAVLNEKRKRLGFRSHLGTVDGKQSSDSTQESPERDEGSGQPSNREADSNSVTEESTTETSSEQDNAD